MSNVLTLFVHDGKSGKRVADYSSLAAWRDAAALYSHHGFGFGISLASARMNWVAIQSLSRPLKAAS